VVTFVHGGLSPAIFRRPSCAGAQNNKQEPAKLIFCHTKCTSAVLVAAFRNDVWPFFFDHHVNFQPGASTSSQ
jgi:hypothetical protein